MRISLKVGGRPFGNVGEEFFEFGSVFYLHANPHGKNGLQPGVEGDIKGVYLWFCIYLKLK